MKKSGVFSQVFLPHLVKFNPERKRGLKVKKRKIAKVGFEAPSLETETLTVFVIIGPKREPVVV